MYAVGQRPGGAAEAGSYTVMEIKILFRWLIPMAKLVWAIWFIGLAFVISLSLFEYFGTLALQPQYSKPMAALTLRAMPIFCLVSMLAIAGFVIYRAILSLGKEEAEKKTEEKDETGN